MALLHKIEESGARYAGVALRGGVLVPCIQELCSKAQDPDAPTYALILRQMINDSCNKAKGKYPLFIVCNAY